jgi:UDP-N-acetylmuramate dehydrogenase
MWQERFAERLSRDRSLAELTTIRIGGVARHLFEPRREAEVGEMLAALDAEGGSYRVLGGGSNLLVPDVTLEGVVIHPLHLDDFAVEGTRITVGAGMSLPSLVARANDLGLGGLHLLAGIPGQVGGALVMNAGGRYGWIAPLVEEVRVRLPGGEPAVLSQQEMGFGYRSSRLPRGAVICSAVLRLEPVDDPRTLKRESGRILKEKNRAQPTTSWTFGCMFANPEGRSAGRLIEEAGLLGTQRGDARISPRHGNFVENLDHARAADVLALIELAEQRVRADFGIELRREVQIWQP